MAIRNTPDTGSNQQKKTPQLSGWGPSGYQAPAPPKSIAKPTYATSIPTPKQSAVPPASRSLGGDTGYDGGGSLGGSGGMAPAVTPPIPTEGEYQAQDAILAAALGALDRAMADYNAQDAADTQNYERDFNKGIDNLGYRDLDAGEGVNMGWDWNDVLTSSGRAYQNQLNDFASRNMLQSQGYADALAQLSRSLNDQKGAMDTARGDFLSDQGRKKTEFGNQDTLARQQARAESTQRRAAQYGIA